MAEPINKLMLTPRSYYDNLYDQDGADEFRQYGTQRVTPTPEFVPGYAFRDPLFVMPPNPAARNLLFDGMDLMDRQHYRDAQQFQLPRVRGR